MANLFSGSEIVQIAVQMEKSGAAFYDSLTKSVENAQARDIFAHMANEERHHIADFQQLLDSVGDYRPLPESYPGEYDLYTKALVDSRVFSDEETCVRIAQNVGNEKEAIQLAISIEKDAIIFLYEMRRFVPPRDKSAVDDILNQEKIHLRRLAELKNEIG